jgi:gentisate 1,2-dioxygenase
LEQAMTILENDSLEALNAAVVPLSMRAGWNKTEPSLWPAPKTAFEPAHWGWDAAKSALDRAGYLITAERAERRNLFCVNPRPDNYYSTLRTLVCAYQMILPGERAPSHRHVPNALRLVLDVGPDCYTVVDGVELEMVSGDVLLTPGWSWHGHGNRGDKPGYWIDFLDVPLVQLLEPMFLENYPDRFQEPEEKTRSSEFIMPFLVTSERLDAAAPDARGRTVISLNSPAMPTTGMQMERIRAGQSTQAERTTANQIVAVVSGSGKSTIGDRTIAWKRGDVVAIPTWHAYQHTADEDAVLFCVSDSVTLEKLNFLKTENA